MRAKRVAVAIGAVVVVGIGVGWALNRSGGGEPDAPTTPVAKVSRVDIQVEVIEVGTLEPEVKVDVKSVLSGKVVNLPVREGDVVRRGQILASIEPDVNQAQSLAAVRRTVNQAVIDYADAAKDFEGKEELLRSGLVSIEVHRQTETRYKAARESLSAAREKAGLLEASGIPVGENASQVLNITAPMDGVVIRRPVELGEAVTGAGSFNAGTVIATVADLSSMIVKAGVNEVDIGKVQRGVPVVVTLDAFPKVRFEGSVKRIAPAARLQDQVKVFDVEITLESLGKELRTGMTANVSIKGERADGALAVPVEAVFRRESGEIVYVRRTPPASEGSKAPSPRATPDPKEVWKQHFEERTVVSGLASIAHAEILEGLGEGEEVALEDPTRPKKKGDGR
jgi:HlyD family secretion protein